MLEGRRVQRLIVRANGHTLGTYAFVRSPSADSDGRLQFWRPRALAGRVDAVCALAGAPAPDEKIMELFDQVVRERARQALSTPSPQQAGE